MTDLAATLQETLRRTVAAAISEAVDDPAVPIAASGPAAGIAAAQAVADAAAERAVAAVAPLVQHATNDEPWYQSRVTWGAVIAAVVPLAGLFGQGVTAEQQQMLVQALVAAGTLAGAGLTLYGRWRARRPIGA